MTTVDRWQTQWLTAIRAMTATADDAARYLDNRLRFTTAVARRLTHSDPRLDLLVYGVWLEGHSTPIYVGQTADGRRRMWDLPIGESHHLANSFPAEIWERVVVVYWGQLARARPELLVAISASVRLLLTREDADPLAAVGVGPEYLLQSRLKPLFNSRKKRRDGGWRGVVWDESTSLGAKVAPHLDELFTVVFGVWEQLATAPLSVAGVIELIDGRVAFPAAMASREYRGQGV